MHGSNWLVKMPPPPPAGTLPLWICNFLSFLEVYSQPPGKQKEKIPHPRAPDRRHIRFLGTSFRSVQSKTRRFHNFYKTLSTLFWERDNRCHNEVNKWTIHLKMKTKKKNSLKSASLIEHFIRTLDRISISLYIPKLWIRFHKFFNHYLKQGWRNMSVLLLEYSSYAHSFQILNHTFNYRL